MVFKMLKSSGVLIGIGYGFLRAGAAVLNRTGPITTRQQRGHRGLESNTNESPSNPKAFNYSAVSL